MAEDIEHKGQQKPKFTSKFNQASAEEKNYLQIYNEEQAKKALEPKKKVEASETYKKLSKERLDLLDDEGLAKKRKEKTLAKMKARQEVVEDERESSDNESEDETEI